MRAHPYERDYGSNKMRPHRDPLPLLLCEDTEMALAMNKDEDYQQNLLVP